MIGLYGKLPDNRFFQDFPGTQDRRGEVFLVGGVRGVLAFEGDGSVYFFEGSYTEYEENRRQRLGSDEPVRFKYKKLME